MKKCIIKTLFGLFLFSIVHSPLGPSLGARPLSIPTVYAVVDPLSVPNNKFGIHIISPTPEEASDAASLVNQNGDWGYVTLIIESSDRNRDKWQTFFNELRRRHLIPIVRLATKPLNEHWQKPQKDDASSWAIFLNSLNWPTQNRYVIVYNEPNHGKEWGLQADPSSYALILNDTIDALKQASPDFFVLNAGFDQAAPNLPPNYFDEENFLIEMQKAVAEIFNKLDGFATHSYPNPGFVGSPNANGRGSVAGFWWEMQVLKRLGLKKALPVFITETGWKHAEGISIQRNLPTSELVGQFLQTAFAGAWNDDNIVSVTPFLLNYQEEPFDHFSFKKYTGEVQDVRILGAVYPDYYPQFEMMAQLKKVKGVPLQDNKAELIKGEVYHSIVAGQSYDIKLTFKNNGQSIWDDQVILKALEGGKELGIEDVAVAKSVEPEKQYSFNLKIKAPHSGSYKVVLNLFNDGREFDSSPVEFTTQVKSPVILMVKSGLNWKKNFSGSYILETKGATGESAHLVELNPSGVSQELPANFLLPDYTFKFTLSRSFYKPKTVDYKLNSGINVLDFGELQPDLLSALLNPREVWRLLPFSN